MLRGRPEKRAILSPVDDGCHGSRVQMQIRMHGSLHSIQVHRALAMESNIRIMRHPILQKHGLDPKLGCSFLVLCSTAVSAVGIHLPE